MKAADFFGEAVKVTAHTIEPDFYRRFGKVLSVGVSHVLVEFVGMLLIYWIDAEILADAGATS